ncbi:ATP phosphoribosyltransferase regulatory subunit [Paracoccus sp. S-4012]|uniref:ATP phosphoribosyltransferase regulatory subunit n=1 Tax=Paracoccus sp. S-4012 TaxID=2665648 RepID=UPI0012AF5DDC|nr:ATP phosphoribosyltransferase regulatory subunit [Paracoccus sp. S-4012]MRX49108.1 ATP phosphoribosyltransferase regulatory subunit [Paracoccus sp. S-4012]
MIAKTAKARTGQRLLAAFREAGADEVSPDVLLPADTLLDLYGEDIRARAYVTTDPLRGEVALRPDFTVPVVRLHMQDGADPARYCYLGEVFRKQDPGEERPADPRDNEYLQVGFEVFDRDVATADAEVFALFHRLLAPLRLTPVMGDMGLVRDAIAALPLAALRRSALLHHIWRPVRFERLLARFSAPVPPRHPARSEAPWTGRRSREEMEARLLRLKVDSAEPPLAPDAAEALRRLLAVAGPAPAALTDLRRLAGDWPGIAEAVERLARRLSLIAGAGVPLDVIGFDASHGRGTMEYYDGMTFSFLAPGRADWPPVASGGRYDLLTAELGRGAAIPAVGGIIRPGLVAELEAGRC